MRMRQLLIANPSFSYKTVLLTASSHLVLAEIGVEISHLMQIQKKYKFKKMFKVLQQCSALKQFRYFRNWPPFLNLLF